VSFALDLSTQVERESLQLRRTVQTQERQTMTQERIHNISETSSAVYAIDYTISRFLALVSREEMETLLPLNSADDDLIQERIRISLGECRNYVSQWIGHGVDNGRYEIKGRPWISRDGYEWIDARNTDAVSCEEFDNATITLIGGPRNGEVIR